MPLFSFCLSGDQFFSMFSIKNLILLFFANATQVGFERFCFLGGRMAQLTFQKKNSEGKRTKLQLFTKNCCFS